MIGRYLSLPKHFYALTNHCLDIIKQAPPPVHVHIVVVVVIVVVIVVIVIVVVIVVDVVVDVKDHVEDNEEEVHQAEHRELPRGRCGRSWKQIFNGEVFCKVRQVFDLLHLAEVPRFPHSRGHSCRCCCRCGC